MCTKKNKKTMENIIEVTIEVPMASDPIKYEVDDATGKLYLDRFLDTAMYYPCNYGFIPHTLAGDGDPIDVMVISPYPLLSGCIARCRAIGVLKMFDEEGQDHKILAVPDDAMYVGWNDLEDVPDRLLSQLRHFFDHYKDLDPYRWVTVLGWEDSKSAHETLDEAISKYNQNNIKNEGKL